MDSWFDHGTATPALSTPTAAPSPEPYAAPAIAKDEPAGIRRGALALFTGPSLPISALGLPLYVSLPEFYANYVGVALATVGLVFMLVRLVDLAIDPVLGAMMDVTRTRFGRFRPWLAVSAPILMVATYMMFMAKPGAGPVYMGAWLFMLYVGYSILVLAHGAWASTLATGYNDRSRIYSWVMTATVIGMLLVLFLPPIVGPLLPGNRAAGVQAMGWFIILLLPVTIGLVVWRTPEPRLSDPGKAKITLAGFLQLARRPAILRILIADLALALAPAITGALFIFFYREARGFTTTQTTTLLLIYFFGGLVGAPLWGWMSHKIGKHRALVVAALHYAVMISFALVLPKAAFALTAVMIFITGLAYTAGTILLRAMMADASDEAELDSGANRIGLLFAMIASTQKVGAALAVGATFPLLQAVGFIPKAGAQNTPFAIHGLELLFVVGPVIFSIVAAMALWNYHLDEKTHGTICAALKSRQA